MFEVLPVNDKNIFAFKASGKLTDEDYKQLIPVMEDLISESGAISLYVELDDFQGWDKEAAWDDMRFYFQHDRDFRRIAIVGENKLEHSGVVLANFFSRTEMRFFKKEKAAQAMLWLEEADKQQREKPLEPYKHIVLATDFSPYSERAAIRAGELAKQYGARLSVLNIVEDVAVYAEGYDPIQANIELDEELKSIAEVNIRSFAQRTGLGKEAVLEVQWGSPKWAISSWAQENEADLVILGTHGRHGFGRLLGSVSNSVMHQAHCDVLVVK